MSRRCRLPMAVTCARPARRLPPGRAQAAALLVAGALLAAWLRPPMAAAAEPPAAPAKGAAGDEHMDMERTKIIGNRELPKVLYIVPWKKPQPGALPGRPLKSVLDEALEPIDRDVFRRQVQYETQYEMQYAAQRAPAAATADRR